MTKIESCGFTHCHLLLTVHVVCLQFTSRSGFQKKKNSWRYANSYLFCILFL